MARSYAVIIFTILSYGGVVMAIFGNSSGLVQEVMTCPLATPLVGAPLVEPNYGILLSATGGIGHR